MSLNFSEIPGEILAALEAEQKAEIWARKDFWLILEWYLDRDQLEDARRFFDGCDVTKGELPKDDWYDELARRRGKSYKWTVIAVAWCHCLPRQKVKYAAQLGKSVRNIIWPTIKALVEDMPPEYRGKGETPEENAEKIRENREDHKWEFPNGSELMAAGMNGDHEDDLRGDEAHIFIKDECGFYTRFEKVETVSNPQTMTTGGVSVYATTPPENPLHPVREKREALKAIGRYSHRTIYGNPRFTAEYINNYIAKEARNRNMTVAQFVASTYFKREFLCMWVTEATRAVIPEWGEDAPEGSAPGTTLGDFLVREVPRPAFFDAYEGLDIGFTQDPSAYLGGFWHWAEGCLVIEDESPPLHKASTAQLAEVITDKRRALWPVKPDPNGRATTPPSVDARKSADATYWLPYASIGDGSGNGADKLNELRKDGIDFAHAGKGALDSRVNTLRGLIRSHKLFIHPRCKNLIAQISTGLWADKQKNDFEHTTAHHHDHLAALVDLVGHINRNRCPYPEGWDISETERFNTAFPDRPKPVTVGAKTHDPAGEDWGGVFGQLPWE